MPLKHKETHKMASFLLLSLMSRYLLRGSETDSEGFEANTATNPVIAKLLI